LKKRFFDAGFMNIVSTSPRPDAVAGSSTIIFAYPFPRY
jgi:hypothetical protein